MKQPPEFPARKIELESKIQELRTTRLAAPCGCAGTDWTNGGVTDEIYSGVNWGLTIAL